MAEVSATSMKRERHIEMSDHKADASFIQTAPGSVSEIGHCAIFSGSKACVENYPFCKTACPV